MPGPSSHRPSTPQPTTPSPGAPAPGSVGPAPHPADERSLPRLPQLSPPPTEVDPLDERVASWRADTKDVTADPEHMVTRGMALLADYYDRVTAPGESPDELDLDAARANASEALQLAGDIDQYPLDETTAKTINAFRNAVERASGDDEWGHGPEAEQAAWHRAYQTLATDPSEPNLSAQEDSPAQPSDHDQSTQVIADTQPTAAKSEALTSPPSVPPLEGVVVSSLPPELEGHSRKLERDSPTLSTDDLTVEERPRPGQGKAFVPGEVISVADEILVDVEKRLANQPLDQEPTDVSGPTPQAQHRETVAAHLHQALKDAAASLPEEQRPHAEELVSAGGEAIATTLNAAETDTPLEVRFIEQLEGSLAEHQAAVESLSRLDLVATAPAQLDSQPAPAAPAPYDMERLWDVVESALPVVRETDSKQKQAIALRDLAIIRESFDPELIGDEKSTAGKTPAEIAKQNAKAATEIAKRVDAYREELATLQKSLDEDDPRRETEVFTVARLIDPTVTVLRVQAEFLAKLDTGQIVADPNRDTLANLIRLPEMRERLNVAVELARELPEPAPTPPPDQRLHQLAMALSNSEPSNADVVAIAGHTAQLLTELSDNAPRTWRENITDGGLANYESPVHLAELVREQLPELVKLFGKDDIRMQALLRDVHAASARLEDSADRARAYGLDVLKDPGKKLAALRDVSYDNGVPSTAPVAVGENWSEYRLRLIAKHWRTDVGVAAQNMSRLLNECVQHARDIGVPDNSTLLPPTPMVQPTTQASPAEQLRDWQRAANQKTTPYTKRAGNLIRQAMAAQGLSFFDQFTQELENASLANSEQDPTMVIDNLDKIVTTYAGLMPRFGNDASTQDLTKEMLGMQEELDRMRKRGANDPESLHAAATKLGSLRNRLTSYLNDLFGRQSQEHRKARQGPAAQKTSGRRRRQ